MSNILNNRTGQVNETQLLTCPCSVDFPSAKSLAYQALAEACGSRTHHPTREEPDQWL